MYTDSNKAFISKFGASKNDCNEGWQDTQNSEAAKGFFIISGNAVLSHDIYEEASELEAKEKYTCGVSEELLQDYVDCELDELTNHRLEKHLDSCKKCSTISNELEGLKNLAKTLNRSNIKNEEVHSRLRLRLLSELNVDIDSGIKDDA